MYYRNLYYAGTVDIQNEDGTSLKSYPKEVEIDDLEYDYSNFTDFFGQYFEDLLIWDFELEEQIGSSFLQASCGDNNSIEVISTFNFLRPESLFEPAFDTYIAVSFVGTVHGI